MHVLLFLMPVLLISTSRPGEVVQMESSLGTPATVVFEAHLPDLPMLPAVTYSKKGKAIGCIPGFYCDRILAQRGPEGDITVFSASTGSAVNPTDVASAKKSLFRKIKRWFHRRK